MGKMALEVKGLDVSLGGKPILKQLSLQIERGTPFAIVGESGSGKTTLLLSIFGLVASQRGDILVDSKQVAHTSATSRSEMMGLVFQDYALFPHMNAFDNITFVPKRRKRANFEKIAQELMEDLGILQLRKSYPHELSGGQKQRVAIARSLILEPQLLFFDEPSAALDTKTSEEVAKLLGTLNHKSQIVVVSHDLPFLKKFCLRGALVHEGRVERMGTLEQLCSQ